MAEYLGIIEQHYQKYEYGKIEPNHETTIKLADYFDVSLDYLTGRSNEISGNEYTLARRLEQCRKFKGNSLKVMSELLGIEENEYKNYENGVLKPSRKALIEIANLWRVTVDYLLGRSNIMLPPELFEDILTKKQHSSISEGKDLTLSPDQQNILDRRIYMGGVSKSMIRKFRFLQSQSISEFSMAVLRPSYFL